MLASLLPGLRDLRAPLSAGYLWLAATWLYFAPHLPTSVRDADGVLRDIYRVIDVSPTLEVGVGLSFLAYMVGILSTGLLTRPVRLAGLTLLALLFVPVFVLSLILGLLAKRWSIFETPLDNTTEWLNDMGSRLFNPIRIRANELVVRRVSESVLADPEYRDVVIGKLASRISLRQFLRTAQTYMLYPRGHLKAWLSQDRDSTLIEVREALNEDLKMGHLTAATVLVKSVVDVDSHAYDVLDELKLVPERIVGDKPATYERWDRLSSEAEFRQAVVPPLIATIGVMFARGVLDIPYGLIVFVAPLVILLQGIRKEFAGQAQLMQAIEAGVVRSASLQSLKASDLRWRSSSSGEVVSP